MSFRYLKAWHNKLVQRPAFQKGIQVPNPYSFNGEAVASPDMQQVHHTIRKFGNQMVK